MRSIHLLATLACLLSFSQTALAEDMRIETDVYKDNEKFAVSHTTTLFHDGCVYDYLNDPPQVAVFDKPHGRFVLLDPGRKLKTYLTTDNVLSFCGDVRSFASDHSSGFLQFCGKPQFAVEYSEKSGELLLSSAFMNYKLQTTKAKSPEAAYQVREFSDWYARLNSMTTPGAAPPFARLAVNEELAKRGLVATHVELMIPPQLQLGGKAVARRSSHNINWRLVRTDFDRISETHTQLVNFKTVPYLEFNRPEQVAKGSEEVTKK